jgi:hypothetical protein
MSAIPSVAEEDRGRRHVVPNRWNLGWILPAPLLLPLELVPLLHNGHNHLPPTKEDRVRRRVFPKSQNLGWILPAPLLLSLELVPCLRNEHTHLPPTSISHLNINPTTRVDSLQATHDVRVGLKLNIEISWMSSISE